MNKQKYFWVVLSAAFVLFMVKLDAFAVNVSVPTIGHAFSLSALSRGFFLFYFCFHFAAGNDNYDYCVFYSVGSGECFSDFSAFYVIFLFAGMLYLLAAVFSVAAERREKTAEML